MNDNKKRFYEYGLIGASFPRGARNSISDVQGVRVGHATKIEGEDVRTGVTVVDPGTKDLFKNKVPGAIAVGNGYGKLTGITQVEELGTIEAPIALTSTLAVGAALQGMIAVVSAHETLGPIDGPNVIVGEINDGFLNDIHANSVTKEDVKRAYENLSEDFLIGNVGGGTGSRAFSWKGGIGTSSRVIAIESKKYTLGVLVQTNFGGSLSIAGVPLGKILGKSDFDEFLKENHGGSCMIVLATDAPFSARQLKRIASRTFLGLARTGSVISPTSGDYAIAFSTDRAGVEGEEGNVLLQDSILYRFFLAAVEATEEAVFDALFAAETLRGRDGNVREAIPVERVVEIIKNYRHGA